MNSFLKIMVFKLQNCAPCEELSSYLDSDEVDVLRDSIQTFYAEEDLPIFKQHRVSGTPQVIVVYNGVVFDRAKGYEACVNLIKRLLLVVGE